MVVWSYFIDMRVVTPRWRSERSQDKPRYNTNENPLHLTYHDIKSKPPPAAGISMFVSSLCGVCPKEIETCTG